MAVTHLALTVALLRHHTAQMKGTQREEVYTHSLPHSLTHTHTHTHTHTALCLFHVFSSTICNVTAHTLSLSFSHLPLFRSEEHTSDLHSRPTRGSSDLTHTHTHTQHSVYSMYLVLQFVMLLPILSLSPSLISPSSSLILTLSPLPPPLSLIPCPSVISPLLL